MHLFSLIEVVHQATIPEVGPMIGIERRRRRTARWSTSTIDAPRCQTVASARSEATSWILIRATRPSPRSAQREAAMGS